MANPLWGSPRIHGELLKLGIEVSQATNTNRVFGSSRVAGVFNRCATSHQVAQSHCTEQGFHLYPSGDVRHGWARAERDFIEIINGSQSAGVKLAEDHPLT